MTQDIYSLVEHLKEDYHNLNIEVVEGYEFSQYETLKLIDLYMNSKFESGAKDALGRDKPFHNIVKHRRNVSVRATDIDTKDIQIKANRAKDQWTSFALSLKLKEWMKRTQFARFLNRANEVRATYGSAIVKKTKPDGKLKLEVVPWNNLITDQIDFYASPVIERHFYSPQQLRAMKGTWDDEMIEDVIAFVETQRDRTASVADKKGTINKTTSYLIEILEVHGEFHKDYLKQDAEGFSKQMHIIFCGKTEKGKTQGFTLYAGEEEESPYKKLDWDTQDGRTLGIGVVEDLFEQQIWTNYIIKQQKDLIDLTSTVLFYKDIDSPMDATNILGDVLPGEILEGQLTQVNSVPTSFPSLDSLLNKWDDNASKVSATFESKTGETMPSGTPFRQVAILNAEADGYFRYKIEGFDLFLQEVLREWVIPYLFEEIRKDREFAADLEPHEIAQIDERYATKLANDVVIDQILDDKIVTPADYEQLIQANKATLEESGVRRFMLFPEDFVDDVSAYEVDIMISGEQENRAVKYENIANILQTVGSAQQPDGSNIYLDDPRLSKIFNQIMEDTGAISPIELPKPVRSP